MSDSNSRDDREDSPPPARPNVEGPDVEDDDLDDEDFERAVAQARHSAEDNRVLTQEEAGLRNRLGWGRSPILAVVVIVVGVFLLSSTWGDFRYFLRVVQSEPRQLGEVSDIYQDGKFSESFDNEWVVLEGQPDVQHAARMKGREGWYGFLRLIEADASLFVAIPRETEAAPAQFPGRFEGRMRRLDATPQWEKLQQFFDAEEVVALDDLDPAALAEAIAAGSSEVAKTDGTSISVAADATLAIVVEHPVGVAQLGRTTWKTPEEAEQAIAALGLPWAPLESKSNMVWQFVVYLGDAAGPERVLELTRTLNGGADSKDPDPKQGALVMPRRVTYLAAFGELRVDGEGLSFPYDSSSPTETGWKVVGDRLEAIAPEAGRLTVPRSRVIAARLQRPLVADPNGYLIMVDQAPFDTWPAALMFVAVFGVVGLNAWTLVTTLRRRRAADRALHS